MGALTLSQGRLFGALYESILYGVQIVLLACMLHLFNQRKLTTASRVRCAVVLLTFTLSTIHLAAVMRGLQQAFFETTLSTDDFFSDRSQPMDLIQKAVYAVVNVLGDGLMIHRLYVIFENDWRSIVLPSMSLAATLATWGALVHEYSLSTPGQTLYFGPIKTLAPVAFILSCLTNIVITGMIVARILLAMRRVKGVHLGTSSSQRFYRTVIAITVESGLLYPLMLLIMGAFYLTRNNGLEILSGSNIQVIAIIPIMMTLQFRLELSLYDSLVKRSRETTFMTLGTMRYKAGATSGEISSNGTTHVNLNLEENEQRAHIVSNSGCTGGTSSWERAAKEGSLAVTSVGV